MTLLAAILDALNCRKSKALLYAQAGLPDSQYQAFRKLFLDEFGRNGLERDLERIAAEHEKRNRKD